MIYLMNYEKEQFKWYLSEYVPSWSTHVLANVQTSSNRRPHYISTSDTLIQTL